MTFQAAVIYKVSWYLFFNLSIWKNVGSGRGAGGGGKEVLEKLMKIKVFL